MHTDLLRSSRRIVLLLALLAGTGALSPAGAFSQSPTPPAAPPVASEPHGELHEAPQVPEPPEVPEPGEIDLGDGDRISVLGGNRTIEEGEVVRDVVVIGGNLRVRGEVSGDAVVVGGNLILYESGRIHGDVVVAGGRFQNQGGTIGGELRTMDRVPGVAAEVQREVREGRHRSSIMSRVGRGFAGIISTLALVVVLGGLGAALVFYGHPYLETVNDTLRSSTLRSGAVGLAALFLVLPAFVLLIVALAVSIVGIPLLLVAIPLYPVAVMAAATFGLLASAHALGERTSEQRSPFDLNRRNSYAYLFTGLVILFAPVVAGYLVGMTPFLGWVGSLIKFFAYVAIWAALTAGLGAVVLSRAGTRRDFARPTPSPLDDTILDDDPFVTGPRV